MTLKIIDSIGLAIALPCFYNRKENNFKRSLKNEIQKVGENRF